MVLDDHTLTLFQVPVASWRRCWGWLCWEGWTPCCLRLGWEAANPGRTTWLIKPFRAGEFRGSSAPLKLFLTGLSSLLRFLPGPAPGLGWACPTSWPAVLNWGHLEVLAPELLDDTSWQLPSLWVRKEPRGGVVQSPKRAGVLGCCWPLCLPLSPELTFPLEPCWSLVGMPWLAPGISMGHLVS